MHLQATVNTTRVSPQQAYHKPESSVSRAEGVFLVVVEQASPPGPMRHRAGSTEHQGRGAPPPAHQQPSPHCHSW